MTQEEKDLVFQDLCARLPYGVIVYHPDYDGPETLDTVFSPDDLVARLEQLKKQFDEL